MAKKVKKLRAPKGTDEANIDGVSYRVENDGTVEVPDGEEGPLLATGGFVEVTPPVVLPEGFALVMHKDPNASCDGEKFGGGHLVQAVNVAALASHGFYAVDHVTETVADLSTFVEKNELKQDGPTVEQWVEASYQAADYPPTGYASKSTPEEIAAAIAAQAEARAIADAAAKTAAEAAAAEAAAAAAVKEPKE